MHREATERGLFPTAEAALTEVHLLVQTADLGIPVPGLGDAVNDAVRRWLDTLTGRPHRRGTPTCPPPARRAPRSTTSNRPSPG